MPLCSPLQPPPWAPSWNKPARRQREKLSFSHSSLEKRQEGPRASGEVNGFRGQWGQRTWTKVLAVQPASDHSSARRRLENRGSGGRIPAQGPVPPAPAQGFPPELQEPLSRLPWDALVLSFPCRTGATNVAALNHPFFICISVGQSWWLYPGSPWTKTQAWAQLTGIWASGGRSALGWSACWRVQVLAVAGLTSVSFLLVSPAQPSSQLRGPPSSPFPGSRHVPRLPLYPNITSPGETLTLKGSCD